jgi:hypothetical protein
MGEQPLLQADWVTTSCSFHDCTVFLPQVAVPRAVGHSGMAMRCYPRTLPAEPADWQPRRPRTNFV